MKGDLKKHVLRCRIKKKIDDKTFLKTFNDMFGKNSTLGKKRRKKSRKSKKYQGSQYVGEETFWILTDETALVSTKSIIFRIF